MSNGIPKIKLPGKVGPPFGSKNNKTGKGGIGERLHTPAIINGRLRAAIKPGDVLNPYGNLGRYRGKYKLGLRVGSRDNGPRIRRKRKFLKEQAALAIELHELQEIAKKNAGAAMVTLAEIMKSPKSPEQARIAAAGLILARAYGKASQTNINANVNTDGKTAEVDPNELDKRITKALERVEHLTGRAKQAPESEERPPDIRQRH